MSGFDKDWLALREPADHAARNAGLVSELARHLDPMTDRRLLDVGCGTGSTWRSLSGSLPGDVDWLLLDFDPVLLGEAERRIGAGGRVRFCQQDLNDVDGLPLDGVAVLTASALFDLCSEAFCAALVMRLAESACGLYAALNYDGKIKWSISHPLDEQVVAAFNKHQRNDKGFGAALGPEAAASLGHHLRSAGFKVQVADSPWRMDHKFAALQVAFLNGFRRPLEEIGDLSEAEIAAWLSYRISAVDRPYSLCEVGHADLLALPA